MTFWHSLVSFKAHLAHLPSPVIVTLSPAAKVRIVVAANNNTATPATNANDFFILGSFRLVSFSSAPADIAHIFTSKSTILILAAFKRRLVEIASNHGDIAKLHTILASIHPKWHAAPTAGCRREETRPAKAAPLGGATTRFTNAHATAPHRASRPAE